MYLEGAMTRPPRNLAVASVFLLATLSIASAQSFETVDFPGAIATGISGGPNPQGSFVGSYNNTKGVLHGYVFQYGVFTSLDAPGSTLTAPNWINPEGVITGSYLDASGDSHGFILKDGVYKTIDFRGAAGTILTGLAPSGVMTGVFCVVASCATGVTHSVLVSGTGSLTIFDPPGAISSVAATVNPSGVIVGGDTAKDGTIHGYQLKKGTFTSIDVPHATFTFAGANDFEGDIVGDWGDSAGNVHGFLLRGGVFTSIDFPGATFTALTGINPALIIVGEYLDSTGVVHGFVRTP